MRLTTTVTYPGDVDSVLAMLLDPEFTRSARTTAAAGALGASSTPLALDVEVLEDSGATELVVTAPVPAHLLPSAARAFAGAGLSVRAVDRWETAGREPGAPVTGALTMTVAGAPARLVATQQLVPTDAGTERRVTGELKVSVPFVGPTIERAAMGQIDEVLRGEQDAAARWLAEN